MDITSRTSYDTFTAFIEAAQTPINDGPGRPFVCYDDDRLYFTLNGEEHEFAVGPGEGQAAHVEFNKRIGNAKFFNDNL